MTPRLEYRTRLPITLMYHCRVDLDGCYYYEWKFSPVAMTALESPFLVQWNGPEFDLLYQLRRLPPPPPPPPPPPLGGAAHRPAPPPAAPPPAGAPFVLPP